MQSGEEFPVFQDRKDIAWGQHWKMRIDESIDAVTFLIPIITPAFFKSKACRDELERFLKRESKLGCNDLILPVYYVECAKLTDKARREADPLAQIIAGRQYTDWRELRYEPSTTPQVRKLLAEMAAQIVKALDRSITASPPHGPAKDASQKKSHSTSAADPMSESAQQTSETPCGPRQKTEPQTLVVDSMYRGDFVNLTDALAAAKPGDRILVRPGLYREGIVIDKPLEIICDGNPGEIVIEAMGKNTVLFRATMGRISNLTLRQAGGGQWFCIDIVQGRFDVVDCDISSQSLACVSIHDGADPRLQRNRIHDGKQGGGIFVFDNGQGTLEDNEIFGNAFSNVEIRSGGNPTLRRNRIHNGKTTGVFVNDNGQGILEDNEIYGNVLACIDIKTGGNPTLQRNRIHDGKSNGVFVYDNGQGTLEDNEIFGNALAGIGIKTGGNPTLLCNRIHDGKQGGVFVYDNGQGMLEDNEISSNAFTGIEIKSGGNPTLRRNRITNNKNHAIWVYDDGNGIFEKNDLSGNNKGAWLISPECLEKVVRIGNQE